LLQYVVRRLIGTLFLLVAVVAATFTLISLAPGDTAVTLAGSGGGDPEYLALLRHRLGLDRSIPEQLASYLRTVLGGDLGFSPVRGAPVLEVILARLPATLVLLATSMAFATLGGLFLGVVAAARRPSRADGAIFFSSLLVSSLPVFWVGQLVVALLAVRLGWLPTGGMTSVVPSLSRPAQLVDLARHLVLPAGVLGLLLLGLVVRTTRASMIEILSKDYIRAARSRGLSQQRVLVRHALPNALRPVVTVVMNQLAVVVTAAVLVETVFSWPGLGRLLLDSVLSRDNPVLVGLLLFSSLIVASSNLVTDLLYTLLDPRVRYW
jgi:peptide/nickel transport system permease protein